MAENKHRPTFTPGLIETLERKLDRTHGDIRVILTDKEWEEIKAGVGYREKKRLYAKQQRDKAFIKKCKEKIRKIEETGTRTGMLRPVIVTSLGPNLTASIARDMAKESISLPPVVKPVAVEISPDDDLDEFTWNDEQVSVTSVPPRRLSMSKIAICPTICYSTHFSVITEFRRALLTTWNCQFTTWDGKKPRKLHYVTSDVAWWKYVDSVTLPWVYYGQTGTEHEPIQDHEFGKDQPLQIFLSVTVSTYKHGMGPRLSSLFCRLTNIIDAGTLQSQIIDALEDKCAVLILFHNGVYTLQSIQIE